MSVNYDVVEEDGSKYNVTYKKDKNILWATVWIKGYEVKSYGIDVHDAYFSLTQKIYQTFHFKL
jgi:hypothetical protein